MQKKPPPPGPLLEQIHQDELDGPREAPGAGWAKPAEGQVLVLNIKRRW